MALVKKLDTGGSLEALNDELGKEIGALNLKSKDERKIRDAVIQYRDYFASPEGKSLTVDSLANTYTISGIGSEKFTGSPDEIHANWVTGKLKIENDEDAKSVAAMLYHKATKNIQGKTTPSSTGAETKKMDIGIQDLTEGAVNDVYGNAVNLKFTFDKLKTDDERKAKIYEIANQVIGSYKTKSGENQDIANYTDLQNIEEIQKAITDKDWDKFLQASYKVKWSPQEWLLKDSQKKQIEEEEAITKATTAGAKYKELGITSPEFQQNLYGKGFTEEADQNWSPDANAPWFRDLIKTQGAKVLYNPTTKTHAIIKGNNYFDYGVSDQFTKGYGHSWKNVEGGVKWYTPELYKHNAAVFGQDKYANQNIGREVHTNLPGIVHGWSDNDQTGAYNKDMLGKRDFTHTLVVENNGGKQYLIKQADGTYKDRNTGEIVPVQISGFGIGSRGISDYRNLLTDINNPLSTIGPKSYYADMDEALTALNQQKQNITTRGEYDEDEMNKLVSHIRQVIGTTKDSAEKKQALQAYADLRELFQANEIPILEDYTGGGFNFHKEGGKIRKAQKGMTFAEYNAKYSPVGAAVETAVAPGGKKAVSTKGMLKNMNALDYASLAGTGLAFVPGVGAIGGAVTTAADLANDIQRGESFGTTALNLGMNLGFTALAFFGAGGLKSLQVGAKAIKAAKAADVGFDIVRAGKKAEAVEKMAIKAGTKVFEPVLAVKRVAKVSEVVNPSVLAKLGTIDDIAILETKLVPAEIEALELAGYIDKTGKVLSNASGKIVNADLHFAKSALDWAPSLAKKWVANPAKALGKTAIKGGEALLKNDKVRKGATVATIGLGAKDAFDVAKTVWEAPDNLSFGEKLGRIQESDLKGMMMAGALGRGAYLGGKYKRAVINQSAATPIANEVRTVTVNGKEYPISEHIEGLKAPRFKLPWTGKETKPEIEVKKLAAVKEEFLKKLKGTDSEKKLMMDEIFKEGKVPTFSTTHTPASTGTRKLNATVNGRFVDAARSQGEYNLAKKVLERDITSAGKWNARPDWLGGEKAKKYEVEVKRGIKALTPERKVELEKVIQNRKALNLQKDMDKADVVSRFGKKIKKSELAKVQTAKRAVKAAGKPNASAKVKQLANEARKNNIWFKEGGIMKYQNAPATQTGVFNQTNNIGSYAKKNINPNTLPFTPVASVNPLAGQINAEHGYEQGYLDFLNTMSEDQFQKYKPEIDTYTQGQGSGYKIGSLKDLQRLGQDKQYGPMHNWLMNEYTRLKGLRAPDMAPMASKPMVPQTKPAPVKTGGDITIQQKPGVWDQLKGKLSSTTVSNALMYLNTIATNMKVGRSKGQAIAAGLFQKPYEKHQYIRDAKTNTLLADRAAAQVGSQTRRIARSISDIDKANAIQLQGVSQGQDLVAKGQAADQAQSNAVRGAQMESDARVDITNTRTLEANREMAAMARKNIHLVNASQDVAQNTALNNLILATNKNIPVEEYKRNNREMYAAMHDPKARQAAEAYSLELNQGSKPFEERYAAEVKRIGAGSYPHKTFEESPYYNQWQERVARARENMDLAYQPIKNLQLAQQFQQPLLWSGKKGGTTLTKQDRLELQHDKQSATSAYKETELVYKAILHNNEMLQKALIKMFK